MASQPQQLHISTHHNQLCSLCTLGNKSQWTKVYYVTLIAAWCVYFVKNLERFFFTIKDTTDSSAYGLNINMLISLIAWIMAVVAITNATADDDLCDPSKGNTVETYHENASFLLFSLVLGYFSLISVMFNPTTTSLSYFSVSVTAFFSFIFLIYAASSKSKSLHTCDGVKFKDSYISSSPSSTFSEELECTGNIVTRCNMSATSRCMAKMKRNNHSAFSIKYNPSNHTTWNILEAKPNWTNVTSELNGVLESFYFEPFQIYLKTTESLESFYFKVFSFVEWQDTPIPENAQSINVADQDQITKLINTLDTNNGKSTHIDVHFMRPSFTGTSPVSVSRWHQKEIYYTPIPIGTNQGQNKYILQRVPDVPLNTSVYNGDIDLNEYMIAHHDTIHDRKLLETKQMYKNDGNNSVSHQSLYGTIERENGYNKPTEDLIIEKMKKVFESESYVELSVGTQFVYLAPEGKSRNTTITCDTYEKSPTSADIEPIAASAPGSSSPGSGSSSPGSGSSSPGSGSTSDNLTYCQNINNQNIHYESTSHSGKDRRFMLNVSITSLFAAISFLRPNFVIFNKDKREWNLFSIIVVFQMFMFLYVSTGFYTDSKTEAYFWISTGFSFLLTFVSYFYNKKDFVNIKSLSSLFAILFNLFLLCHLIVQFSSGTSSNQTYSTERVSPWFIPAIVFLFLFLFIPFDEEEAPNKKELSSYVAKLFKTSPVRLLILFLFIICTTIFSNNYLDIPKSVRLIFTIILSITLLFLTLPKFDTVFDENDSLYSEYKASAIVSIILSIFFSLNNFLQSFSNYTSESGDQYLANISNLYNASSALSVSLVSLMIAQLVFGKKAFYPMAIMCSIPFLTLYQYEAVKESASDVCAVKVTFGEDASGSTMLYNSKDCGDGSILSPDPDCQFSKQTVFQVEMLDKKNNCQVILHENIGDDRQKTVWSLNNINLKFNENCSSITTDERSCLRNAETTAQSVTVLQRCQIKVYPAGSVDPQTNTVTPPGYHLRIREDKLGVKGLNFAEDFEAWVDTEDAEGQITSTLAIDTDSMFNTNVWKDLRVDRVVITGSDFSVLGYEKNTNATGLGLNWIYVGTTLPSISAAGADGAGGAGAGGAGAGGPGAGGGRRWWGRSW